MQIFTIPNLLSVLRICLIPVIVYAHASGHPVVSGILIIASGLTDMLDGYIARRFNQISQLGKVLDPIADKLTQVAVALMLCFFYYETIPLFVLLVIKEVAMGILGLKLLKEGGTAFGAFWWGKISTFLLYVYMIMMVFVGGMLPLPVRIIAVCVVFVALLVSFVRYVPYFKKIPDERKPRRVK